MCCTTVDSPKLLTTRDRRRPVWFGQQDQLVDLDHISDGVAVVRVEIPGVPLIREIGVQLQQIRDRPGRHDLAVGSQVTKRDDEPTLVDDDVQDVVVQHDLAGALGGAHRPGGRGGRGGAERRNTIDRERRGIEFDHLGPIAIGQRLQRRVDQRFELNGDQGVVRLGLPMDPGDRAARQDVVELLQQHQFPDPLERVVWIGEQATRRRRGRPQFRLAQQMFAASVALLGLGLRGVRPAVDLQVQLTGPHRCIGILLLGAFEELGRRLHPDAWRPFEISRPAGPADHLPGRPTPAVAPAERHQ